ncbi:hypothetical protein [Nostoc sp. CCY 9925]|uniref:hypothetical protein n=1 Tax=Nostoc sp. CCY 9925 TaxID=3103865 RepID=UPI0039C61992
MNSLYTINLKNESPNTQEFFFFQKPANYIGSSEVYSNSIYSSKLRGHGSGATLTFKFIQQYYAGVQEQAKNIVVGEASGYESAIKEIDLTLSPSISENNSTSMLIDEGALGLTDAIHENNVPSGAFRIHVPTFNPYEKKYNAGLAIQNPIDGSITLSNFINAEPTKLIDVQPVLKFYIQTGSYEAGSVVNFMTSSVGAAVCDMSLGVLNYQVTYTAEGLWKVNSSQIQPGLTQLMFQPQNNVEIENEAGTAVISQGYALNLNSPIEVQNLTDPDKIKFHLEYQVGKIGGPYKGYMCTEKAGNTATFS